MHLLASLVYSRDWPCACPRGGVRHGGLGDGWWRCGMVVPCIVGTGLAPVLGVGCGMVASGTGGRDGAWWPWGRVAALGFGGPVPGMVGCGAPQPPTSSQSLSLFHLLQFQFYWIISNILPCLLKLLSIANPTIIKSNLPDNSLTFQSSRLDMFKPRHRSK